MCSNSLDDYCLQVVGYMSIEPIPIALDIENDAVVR